MEVSLSIDARVLALVGLVTLILAGATLATLPIRGEAAPASTDGAALFVIKGCSGCHSRGGEPQPQAVAPDLGGLLDRAGQRVKGLSSHQYVRQSILDPQAFVVPGFAVEMPRLSLSEREIETLSLYLLSSP